MTNIKDQIPVVDPFERFADSYFSQDPGAVNKKIKRLRQMRVTLINEVEAPRVSKATKGKKATTKKTKAVKEPSLAGLKKLLGKIKKSDLDKLALKVKEHLTLEEGKK